MDLYIIKLLHTHTHTGSSSTASSALNRTHRDTLSCLSELARFIWRQKHRPWRRSLHMVIPFHPNTSTRSLTLSVTAPVYIRVNKRWRRTGESDTCVNEGGRKAAPFALLLRAAQADLPTERRLFRSYYVQTAFVGVPSCRWTLDCLG